jgi:hypothetical protein
LKSAQAKLVQMMYDDVPEMVCRYFLFQKDEHELQLTLKIIYESVDLLSHLSDNKLQLQEKSG